MSLETRHPFAEFDVIGFSLSYKGTYTNILKCSTWPACRCWRRSARSRTR